jgi:D-threo-aldose 1-dehydrogenase
MGGCFPALAELRAAGVIKAIGVGLNESDMSLRFVREADIDCVMLAGRYTLREQGALNDLLPVCEQKGVSILLAGPLTSGILATGAVPGATYNYQPAPAPVMERVGRLEAVCRRHGVDLATAALQFPLSHPCMASIVAGAVHPDEVSQNVAADVGAHPGVSLGRVETTGPGRCFRSGSNLSFAAQANSADA